MWYPVVAEPASPARMILPSFGWTATSQAPVSSPGWAEAELLNSVVTMPPLPKFGSSAPAESRQRSSSTSRRSRYEREVWRADLACRALRWYRDHMGDSPSLESVCDTMETTSLRARRPYAQAMHRLVGLRLAAGPHRPPFLRLSIESALSRGIQRP